MASNFLQRRTLDPFSDAARFPTLQTAADQLNDASAQHTAAVAGGPNSVAARFDPLNGGSIFSREQPGAFDAAQTALEKQNPANNYYGGLQRKGDAKVNAPPQLDSSLRYGIDTGQISPDKAVQQQGLSATDRYAIDTGYKPAPTGAPTTPVSPTPSLRKRILDGVSTFDNG